MENLKSVIDTGLMQFKLKESCNYCKKKHNKLPKYKKLLLELSFDVDNSVILWNKFGNCIYDIKSPYSYSKQQILLKAFNNLVFDSIMSICKCNDEFTNEIILKAINLFESNNPEAFIC